jgi:hypothetical protein
MRSFTGTVSIEVVVDTLLAFMESVMALLWALENRLGLLGLTLPGGASDVFAGVNSIEIATAWLDERYELVEVRSDGQNWTVQLGNMDNDQLAVAATLAQSAPGGIELVEVLDEDRQSGEFEVPLKAFNQFQTTPTDGDRLSAIAAVVELLRNSELDGRPALAPAVLQMAAAAASVELLTSNATAAIPGLRHFGAIAEDLGYDEIRTFCSEAIRAWQSQDSEPIRIVLATARNWLQDGSPELPAYRTTRVTLT